MSTVGGGRQNTVNYPSSLEREIPLVASNVDNRLTTPLTAFGHADSESEVSLGKEQCGILS